MIVNLWHSLLDMPKHDRQWHLNDVNDEVCELKEARTFLDMWSEKADVVYTYTRARWSGHDISFPLSNIDFLTGAVYIYPKFTLRWLFFYVLGKRLKSKRKITEVRNPAKSQRLREIAVNYDLDSDMFEKEARRIMRGGPRKSDSRIRCKIRLMMEGTRNEYNEEEAVCCGV